MRWNSKSKKNNLVRYVSRRLRWRFALWPIRVGDIWVWLESYKIEQEYVGEDFGRWLHISVNNRYSDSAYLCRKLKELD